MSFPTYTDLVGNTFADINGSGLTHRHWMGAVGDFLDADTVVTAPASSARNVIQSSTDATELTLKAFAGQTAPCLSLLDEENNSLFKVTQSVTAPGRVTEVVTAGDDDVNGVHYYTLSLSDDGTTKRVEQLIEASSDGSAGGSAPDATTSWVAQATATTAAASLFIGSNWFPGNLSMGFDESAVYLGIVAQSGQTAPLLELKDASDVTQTQFGPAGQVGFHGVTPVVQAAHPTTLGDVIAILTNVGLCAP